jgi:hypothetical protein
MRVAPGRTGLGQTGLDFWKPQSCSAACSDEPGRVSGFAPPRTRTSPASYLNISMSNREIDAGKLVTDYLRTRSGDLADMHEAFDDKPIQPLQVRHVDSLDSLEPWERAEYVPLATR